MGLADTNIKESKERVRTAIKNCDIDSTIPKINSYIKIVILSCQVENIS